MTAVGVFLWSQSFPLLGMFKNGCITISDTFQINKSMKENVRGIRSWLRCIKSFESSCWSVRLFYDVCVFTVMSV